MYCNRLHAWWSTQSRLATLLSSLIARRWVRLQTLWWFRLKDLSIGEMVGAWCFGFLSGSPGFTCWISYAPVFSFIYCWVLIFALSPCYILIYMFRRWCIDKLGVFHANQMYKLKKIDGSDNFSAQFIKIISHYKKTGYNINVLQQTACLVVNPVTVGNFAFLFNCTSVG